MSLTRISITIPPELVEAADRRAAAMDRSRSWLVVEALRSYLNRTKGGAVREPAVAYRPGLNEHRLQQLEADLALSTEERVALAEQTALVAQLRGRPPQRDRIVGFDRLEDFLAWERREGLDP